MVESVDAGAGDVGAVLAAAGAERPRIVGHSLGGIVATAAGSVLPFAGIVNIDQSLQLGAFKAQLMPAEPMLRDPAQYQLVVDAVFEAMTGDKLADDEVARHRHHHRALRYAELAAQRSAVAGGWRQGDAAELEAAGPRPVDDRQRQGGELAGDGGGELVAEMERRPDAVAARQERQGRGEDLGRQEVGQGVERAVELRELGEPPAPELVPEPSYTSDCVNSTLIELQWHPVTDPDGDTITFTVDGIYQDEPVNGDDDGDTTLAVESTTTTTTTTTSSTSGGGSMAIRPPSRPPITAPPAPQGLPSLRRPPAS